MLLIFNKHSQYANPILSDQQYRHQFIPSH